MLKNRVAYLIIAASLAVLFLLTGTYGVLTLLLAALAAAALSGVMMLLPAGKLAVSVAFGGDHSAAVNITNRSVFPVGEVGFSVVLANHLTLGEARQRYTCYVNGRTTVSRELDLGKAAPGTLEIFIDDIVVRDGLRIFRKKVKAGSGDTRVVYPQWTKEEVDLSQLILEAEDSARYSEHKPGSDQSELFAIREYKPGDSPKAVHWKQSAKTDKLMVREFSLPVNSSLVLLLELSQDTEEAIERCAACWLGSAAYLAENGIPCNLAWYDAGLGRIHVREIFAPEDLSLAEEELLASYGYRQPQFGLYAYREEGYLSGRNLLVYVSSDTGGTLIAEAGRQQSIRLLEPERPSEYGG